MYQEFQRLKIRQRETHTLDATELDGVDSENYMVSRIKPKVHFDVTLFGNAPIVSKSGVHSDVALLDSATTHTTYEIQRILRFPAIMLKPSKIVI